MSTDGVEVVYEALDEIGEGPVWCASLERLCWVDIRGRRVHQLDPVTGVDWVGQTPLAPGAIVPRRQSGFVAALEDGFWTTDDTYSAWQRQAKLPAAAPTTRMNDGKCDRAGRLWAGSMAWESWPGHGRLHRVGTDWSVTPVLEELSVSNGIAWSLDDRLMYFIDSPTHRVDVFDFDLTGGTVSNRRPFIHIPPDAGQPDGMTIDAEGCLWVALWDGGAVRRYSPAGRLLQVVKVPVRRVTSCAFGSPDYADLFITTARWGLTPPELADQPLAGAIFCHRPRVGGMTPDVFDG